MREALLIVSYFFFPFTPSLLLESHSSLLTPHTSHFTYYPSPLSPHLQTTLNPVQNGIEMVMDNVEQLRTVINRIRSDSTQSTNPLTMKLNGTLDAAVNGGVSMFEVCFLTLCMNWGEGGREGGRERGKEGGRG